jgi:peptidoglycan/LPS O-acetylase OafA/YrhL
VAVVGTVMDAIWRTQTVGGELPPGVLRTTEGRLHDLGTLLILAGLVVSALASLWRLRTRRWRTTTALLALGFVLVPAVLVALGLDWPGIGQRGIILVGVLYAALAAVELDRPGAVIPTRARRTPAPAPA